MNQSDRDKICLMNKIKSHVDKNTSAAFMSEEKIERYFGEIVHEYPSSRRLESSIPGETSSEIIDNFINEMQHWEMPFSVADATELVEKVQNVDERMQCKNNLATLLIEAFRNMLRDIDDEVNASKKEWFTKFSSNVRNVKTQFLDYPYIPNLLTAFSDISHNILREKDPAEVMHALWRKVWECLVSCSVAGLYEDCEVLSRSHGECVGKISVTPVPVPTSDSESSSCPEIVPVTITVKPDFTVRGTKTYGGLYPEKKFNILIAEVKATSHDGDANPLVESDFTTPQSSKRKKSGISSADEPEKKKRAHHLEDDKPNTLQPATEDSSDQSKSTLSHFSAANSDCFCPTSVREKHRLGHIRTQHFVELLGMLKTGNGDPGFINSWRVYGLYCVKNRAYITHLMPDGCGPDDLTNGYNFLMLNNSIDYHKSNKSVYRKRFKMGTVGYFNIFKVAHVEALIKILKFITWHECKKTLLP